jgi:hypothetical protein
MLHYTELIVLSSLAICLLGLEGKPFALFRDVDQDWRQEYNRIRPYSALKYSPPAPEATMATALT